MDDPLLFVCSLVFLAGILMVAASVSERVRARYPGLMLQGFLVAVASFGLVLLVGILR